MVDAVREQEVWKQYPDYPFIEANQFGEIRIKDRVITRSNERKQFVKGRVLKQRLRFDGYMDIQFQVNGKKINLKVHRIVAICFIPNPNNYPEVNHIDNDRTNNNVSNLEWCSSQYNQNYKKNFGTSPAEVQGRPVIAVNPETSEVLYFGSRSEASRRLGVNRGSLSSVVKGKLNQTGGYWFCNADEKLVEKARAKFGDEIAKKVEELMHNKS